MASQDTTMTRSSMPAIQFDEATTRPACARDVRQRESAHGLARSGSQYKILYRGGANLVHDTTLKRCDTVLQRCDTVACA